MNHRCGLGATEKNKASGFVTPPDNKYDNGENLIATSFGSLVK